jgi:hypothetical protein
MTNVPPNFGVSTSVLPKNGVGLFSYEDAFRTGDDFRCLEYSYDMLHDAPWAVCMGMRILRLQNIDRSLLGLD